MAARALHASILVLSLLAVPRITTHPGLMLLRAGALVALGFSAALAIEYYGPGATFCDLEGGCAQVHGSVIGRAIGDYLPVLGLFAYTVIFVASMLRSAIGHRIAIYGAILGGLGGAAFLTIQGAVIGAWCELCVGVDTSAIVAAAGGGWLLGAKPAEERLGHGLASPWWALYWPIVFGPAVWVLSFPDPDVPPAIRELWDRGADVNIVEMADFECPYCRAMHPVLKEAIERSDADVHLARIVYPLSFHPHARNSARAYFCAVEQERGDAMADALFTAEDISEEGNRASAEQIGLDLEAFDACVDAERTEERVEEDLARGDRAGMEGLPSVYVGEQTFRGFAPGTPPDPYVEAIEATAAGAGKRTRLWPSVVIGLLSLGSLVMAIRARRPRPRPDREPPAAEPKEPAARRRKRKKKKRRKKGAG